MIAARILLAAAMPALLVACSAAPGAGNASGSDGAKDVQADAAQGGLSPIVIRTATGAHRFDVEVARTKAEQEQGLMFRKELAADGGMIFPMAPPRTASFWMENTVIPLDMLFIRTDGTIAFLKANAEPYSRIPVSAGVPVAAVLELRGGRAAELGITEGDRVDYCRDAAAKPVDARPVCPARSR